MMSDTMGQGGAKGELKIVGFVKGTAMSKEVGTSDRERVVLETKTWPHRAAPSRTISRS